MSFDWATIIEQQGAALAAAVAKDPTAAVPAAPGWDTSELLRHVGLIHARTTVVLRTGTMERPSRENGMIDDAPQDGLVEWFRAGVADVAAAVRAIDDPDRPVYAFAPHLQRAGFWPRRMAHETTIHRIDAEQAVGAPVGPVDADFAVDGLDEALTVLLPLVGGRRSPGDGRVVHLHATDAEGEWLVRFDEGAVAVETGHAKGDAAVRGPAGDLLLWLWGRRTLHGLEVFGDAAAADVLRAMATV